MKRLPVGEQSFEKLILNKSVYVDKTAFIQQLISTGGGYTGTETEGYYHNLFEIIAKFSGMDILTENRTDIGRADCVLKFPAHTYVIEIKYSPDKGGLQTALDMAMRQIREKEHYRPWLHQGKRVHLLALAFTKGDIGFKEELITAD